MCPGCMGGQPLGCDKLIIKVDSLLENRTESKASPMKCDQYTFAGSPSDKQ